MLGISGASSVAEDIEAFIVFEGVFKGMDGLYNIVEVEGLFGLDTFLDGLL